MNVSLAGRETQSRSAGFTFKEALPSRRQSSLEKRGARQLAPMATQTDASEENSRVALQEHLHFTSEPTTIVPGD